MPAPRTIVTLFAALALVALGAVAEGQSTQPSHYRAIDTPLGRGGYGGYRVTDLYSNYYPSNGGSDYPAAAVEAVPNAAARAAIARAQFRRAEDELDATIMQVQEQFEYSPQTLAAVAAQKEAFASYEAARQRSHESIDGDPNYQAALDLKGKIAQSIQDKSASTPHPRSDEMVPLASAKLQYAEMARKMEENAENADPAVKEARQRLVEASTRLWAMQARFDREIRQNPQILAARNVKEDARIAMLAAETYYDAVVDARDLALNYAFYLHRTEQPLVSNFYGLYGGVPYYGN